jgi:hypothetical protein
VWNNTWFSDLRLSELGSDLLAHEKWNTMAHML